MYTVKSFDGDYHEVQDEHGGYVTDSMDLANARRIARALNIEAAIGEVREALEEAKRDYEIMAMVKPMAHGLNVAEDAPVFALCERHGYGAVIDSAARQWFLLDEKDGALGGSHTGGPCYGTVLRMLERTTKALAALDRAGEV